ncbi:MAG: hypothetical protein Q9216_006526 [Gyalolechia sp. 2 TL-2023]
MTSKSQAEDTHDTQDAHVLSDAAVRQFLRKYYYIANEPSLDTEYGDLFTEDAVFIMADKKSKGREGKQLASSDATIMSTNSHFQQAIRALRKKLWQDVLSRDHSPIKMFSHGNHEDDTELMVLGTTTWTYEGGHTNVGDWAAHVKLEKGDDGKLRCSYYQVIMDTAVHAKKPS